MNNSAERLGDLSDGIRIKISSIARIVNSYSNSGVGLFDQWEGKETYQYFPMNGKDLGILESKIIQKELDQRDLDQAMSIYRKWVIDSIDNLQQKFIMGVFTRPETIEKKVNEVNTLNNAEEIHRLFRDMVRFYTNINEDGLVEVKKLLCAVLDNEKRNDNETIKNQIEEILKTPYANEPDQRRQQIQQRLKKMLNLYHEKNRLG